MESKTLSNGKMYPVVVDNFFEDPDRIRNYALSLQYRNPNVNDNERWLGYRSFTHCKDLEEYIALKIKDHHHIDKLNYFFHYSSIKTKETAPWNFDNYKIHKDLGKFAGVIYLNPQPPKNTGLSFYDNDKVFTCSIENIYNRFIFYPCNIFHAPTNLFGDSKENSRLTLTVYCH